ncbi:hypothetical protein F4560_000312 [Saccharothrix ecbatanensis]|uniref:DUF397 domain-containing protein n=1 Tax=Saccharothrix ecbatanensis TaxID=1105145 RepID=A0A7W9HEL4_9PSEU|nr:DUF397 domain-containing protein [Saccharothrix ecbatanensis]MBB5800544.1 hypothetical protein [Saccharothrix ecbatanensis]
MPDQQGTWRKSARSSTNAACVELVVSAESTGVRDSKQPAAGELNFPRGSFGAFLTALKNH